VNDQQVGLNWCIFSRAHHTRLFRPVRDEHSAFTEDLLSMEWLPFRNGGLPKINTRRTAQSWKLDTVYHFVAESILWHCICTPLRFKVFYCWNVAADDWLLRRYTACRRTERV